MKIKRGVVINLANSEKIDHFFKSSIEPRLEIVQSIKAERQTECIITRLGTADKKIVVATSINENCANT